MSYHTERKRYDYLKSLKEQELYAGLMDGVIKVGSEQYDELCKQIEQLDSIASRFQTAYDEND